MRIVVTGGAGFVGSAACRLLVTGRGATVLNIDRMSGTSSLASLATIATSPRYSFRKADTCDRARVRALLDAFAPDAVIHCAAVRDAAQVPGGSAELILSNVTGTARLLEAAHDYWSRLTGPRRDRFRVLHVSSAEAASLADAGGQLVDSAFAAATDPYIASKAAAAHLAMAWHRSYGLPVMVCNAPAGFGPCQLPGETVPRLIIAALEGQPLSVAAGQAGARDWLHVEDLARAFDLMLTKGTPGAIYAPTARKLRSPHALAERILELVDRHSPKGQPARRSLIDMPARGHAGPAPVLLDPSSLERDTGWHAEQTIETGLASTVRWYLANERWWRPLYQAHEAGWSAGLQRSA